MGDWPDDPTTPSPTEVNVTDGPDADPHPERGEGAREPDAWMTEARFPDHGWCGLHLFCNRQRAEESAEFGRRDDQPPFDTTEIRVVPLYRDALTDREPGEDNDRCVHGRRPLVEGCPDCYDEAVRDPTPQRSEGEDEDHWSREASVESLLNALNGEIGVLEEDAKAALSEMRKIKDELARRLRAPEDQEPRGGGGDG